MPRRAAFTLIELPAVRRRERAAFTLIELPAVRRRERAAFTLIELLVVVAIIAALIAILLPSMTQARQVAENAVCGANLRGFGQAQYAYTVDHKEAFVSMSDWAGPATVWWGQTAYDEITEQGTLWRYLNSIEIYTCRTFAKICGREDPYRSYAMSWNIGNYMPTQTIAPPGPWRQSASINRMSQVRTASMLGLMTEENTWAHPTFAAFGYNDGRLVLKNPDWPLKDTVATYHLPSAGRYAQDGYAGGGGSDLNSGIGNVVFVDGHVESVETTLTPQIFNPQ